MEAGCITAGTLPDNIPEELKHIDSWMGTRFERRPGKRDKLNKPPYRVRAGLPVIKTGKNNPANHATYEEARAALERGDVDAIGFVLTSNDPFVAVDLDRAIDPETGEICSLAPEVVDTLNSYTEISVSGTGLHIICRADKPGKDCTRADLGVECYDGRSGARFLVVTGNVLFGPGADGQIQPRQEEIERLYREWWPEAKSIRGRTSRPSRPPETQIGLADDEILARARSSRTGKRFIKLFDHGDRSGYKSANEADFALINMLLFWCAGDGDRVETLFRKSALYRPPPEKHKTYVKISMEKALSSYRGSYYQPKAVREKSTQRQRDVLTPYLALLLDATRWKGQKYATAYKAYAALVIMSVENGIATDTDELHVDGDVRSLAERAGANRVTLCRSSLPLLVKEKLLTWQRGSGNKRGTFILRRPEVPSEATIKVSTQYFNGSTYGDGLDSLSRLIRMRSGVSKTGRVTRPGVMQTVARLGMVAMFVMVTFTTSPRGLNIDEVVERTGRRKDHIRNTLEKLLKSEILEEHGGDFYTFAPAFWKAYQTALISSGIVAAERKQREQHQEERRKNEEKLKEGREKRKFDQKVIDLDAKRRKKLDEAARREQPVDKRYREKRPPGRTMWEDRDWLKPEEQAMQDDYDRMCARVQERLDRPASRTTSGRRSSG